MSPVRWIPRFVAATVAALGCLVLVGWARDIALLRSVAPALANMKPNTALGFILSGLSLFLLAPETKTQGAIARLIGRLLAVSVILLGTTVLGEHLFAVRQGIDEWLFQNPVGSPAAHPNRMTLMSAMNFAFVGAALLTLDYEGRRGHRPAQFLALAVAVTGSVATLGYLDSLATVGRLTSYTSMSLHTALAFTVLGLGILATRLHAGLPALFLTPGPGGVIARRLLPAIFLGMPILGWLALVGERTNLISGEVQLGMVVIGAVMLFTTIVYATALAVEKADASHRSAENAVLRSGLRKKAIFDAAPDAVITIDGQGMVLEFNPAAERLFGYSEAEAEGRDMANLIVPPELRASHRAGLSRLGATGEHRILGSRMELPAMRRDGSTFPIEMVITRVAAGANPIYTGFLRDISARKRSDDELRHSEERFRLLATATSDVVWDWNLGEGTVWWNDGVQKLFGYDAADASADPAWWQRHVEPGDIARVRAGLDRALAGIGSSWKDEYRFRRADGTIAVVQDTGLITRDAAGRALRMVGATIDVTDRRNLEDQLRQAQKMEAVGQLAGGVAHDFNNLLTAILGYAELLEPKVSEVPLLRDYVREIRKGGERAASLTRQLLVFSRSQVLEPKVLDLNGIIRDLDKMLQRLISEDIVLVTRLAPNLDSVLADAGQIEQAIVNLVVNSRDAMPDGGRLTIETRNADLDQAFCAGHPTAQPGPHVMLAVTDTGIGMDAATLSRVFEPFFTTKGVGKGTGLGLSTTYGIMKQSGGNIWVDSEAGKGTTFRIYLPRAEPFLAPIHAVAARLLPVGLAHQTILLVEDDGSLRKLTSTILSVLGYTVLEAETGEEGLRIAIQHAGPIDLVLTDVVMPGMGGCALATRLREIRPGARILYMSGYPDGSLGRHGDREQDTAFLQKPFTLGSLEKKVREVLIN